MVVSWVTATMSASTVEYGTSKDKYDFVAYGNNTRYHHGLLYISPYIHHVHLVAGMTPSTTYYYRCGDGEAGVWSEQFSFTTPLAPARDATPVFALVGDLGQTAYSNQTVSRMLEDTSIQMVVHVGDLSYADGDQDRWDSWGRMKQRLSAVRPWMVAAGNHEVEPSDTGRFEAYQGRFRMPSAESGAAGAGNLWYSYNVGSVHWVHLCSYSDVAPETPQYEWLLRDLQSVDRHVTPWLFVVLHAPWYNSNTAHQGEKEPIDMKAAMEPVFFEHKVNGVFCGHVHAYERSHKVYNGTYDAGAPIYINIGDGGNREGLAKGWLSQPPWSAYRAASYGYGRLTVHSATDATWKWFDDSASAATFSDEVYFVQGATGSSSSRQ